MANYAWEFGSEGSGLWYTITYNSDTGELTVSSLEGNFDLNALWFGDGDTTAGEYGGTSLSKSDSALNMNGSGVAWDGYIKFSNAGLGTEGTDKDTYISDGETKSFTLTGTNLTNFEAALAAGGDDFQIGVRATSVSGDGYTGPSSVKDVGDEIPPPEIYVEKSADHDTVCAGEATEVTYHYEVQNIFVHETFDEMTLVSLVDDKGTPGDTGDDIDLLSGTDGVDDGVEHGQYYTGGDTDNDGLIDVGETWTFDWTTTITLANVGDERTNTVTATGESKGLVVSDTDTFTITAVECEPPPPPDDDDPPPTAIAKSQGFWSTHDGVPDANEWDLAQGDSFETYFGVSGPFSGSWDITPPVTNGTPLQADITLKQAIDINPGSDANHLALEAVTAALNLAEDDLAGVSDSFKAWYIWERAHFVAADPDAADDLTGATDAQILADLKQQVQDAFSGAADAYTMAELTSLLLLTHE